MLNDINLYLTDLLCTLLSAIVDVCAYVYSNTHMYLPVNNITKALCPVLMAKNITPVLWHALNTPDRLFLVLFFYVYAIWSFSSYQLTVTQVISNKRDIIRL